MPKRYGYAPKITRGTGLAGASDAKQGGDNAAGFGESGVFSPELNGACPDCGFNLDWSFDTGTLTVTITDDEGNPIPGVTVSIA